MAAGRISIRYFAEPELSDDGFEGDGDLGGVVEESFGCLDVDPVLGFFNEALQELQIPEGKDGHVPLVDADDGPLAPQGGPHQGGEAGFKPPPPLRPDDPIVDEILDRGGDAVPAIRPGPGPRPLPGPGTLDAGFQEMSHDLPFRGEWMSPSPAQD